MGLHSHAFAGNPIGTRTPKQTDPFSPQSALQTLKTLLSCQPHEPVSPEFKALPFRKGLPLTGSFSENGQIWHLGWLSLGDCWGFLEYSEVGLSEDSFVYLGCRYEDVVVYWAIDVFQASGLVSELGERQFYFVELRTLMVATDWADAKSMGELAIAGHVSWTQQHAMPCHAMPGNGWLGSSHMLNQLAYMWIKTSYKIDAKWHSREDIKKALTYAEYKKAQKTAAAKVEQMCKGVKKSQQLSADFNIESGELAPTFIPGLFAIAHHLVTSWVNRVPPHVVDTQKQEEWFSIEFVD